MPIVRDWQADPPNTTWRLRRKLCRLRLNPIHDLNKAQMWLENSKEFLADLETIKCLECDGHGHTTKSCPTRVKIVNFCKGSKYSKTFVNSSRNRMFESHGC